MVDLIDKNIVDSSRIQRDVIDIPGVQPSLPSVVNVRDGRTSNRTDLGFSDSLRSSGSSGSSGSSSLGSDDGAGRGGRDGEGGKSPLTSPNDEIWNPNTDLSNEENIASLYAYLNSLFKIGSYDSALLNGDTFANILEKSLLSISRISQALGLESAERIALAEHLADFSASFIQAQFQAALSYQSWYLQQEYNSPINQINRLAEAGMSSAFLYGGLSSGNAQSAASMPSNMPMPSPSGTGSLIQQRQASENSLFGSIFGAGVSALGSLVSAGAGAVLSLAQAATIKAMRPYEIARAGSEIVNNGATYEVLRKSADEISNNIVLKNFDTLLQTSKILNEQQLSNLNSMANQNETAWKYFSEEVELQTWQTDVIDKYGNKKSYTLSNDDLEFILSHGGKTRDGSTVVNSDSWYVNGEVSAEARLGVAKMKGKVGAGYSSGAQDGKSHDEEQNYSNEQKGVQRKADYSENGSSFMVGKTKFTSTITRKRMPLKEHKDYVYSVYQQYQNALDEYNTYSTGAKARLCNVLDGLTRNLSSLNANTIKSIYLQKIKDLFAPKVLQGD